MIKNDPIWKNACITHGFMEMHLRNGKKEN
jgi:hypothetical protein